MEGVTQPGESIEGDRDVISNLDVNLLINILSRLSIEDVVRTSILSRGWRYKWLFIDKVRINDLQPVENMDAYVTFVDRVLRLPTNPNSFDLCLHRPYGPVLIRRWITYMLRRMNIARIKLRYFQDYGTVFPNMFNFTELRDLELEWYCMLNFPATNFFPNLRRLYLKCVTIGNEDPENDSMLLKFPVLESLTLKVCRWVRVKDVEINAPSLTAFNCGTVYYYGRDDEHSIRIIGAKLTKFFSSNGLLEAVVTSNDLSTVVSAGFMNRYNLMQDNTLSSESTSRARKLMKEMLHVEDLKISVFMLEGMLKCGPLCQYNKLQRLRLNSNTTNLWNTEAVCKLLFATPYLKSLTIKGINWEHYHGNEIVMQPVPSCIIHHLEEVHFNYKIYIDKKHRLHVEKFLLTNGLQLRKCYISSFNEWTPKHKIVKRLSAFIPESSSCHVSVAMM